VRFPRINLLVTTAGTINFESMITSEGLKVSTALWYYARWARTRASWLSSPLDKGKSSI
jgi:hypothetical protein